MKIFVTQIYIQARVSYPFSHHFQHYLSRTLTELVEPSENYLSAYGEDYDLTFNMSAKQELAHPEIKGPAVFKKDRDVEFTIFLTFDERAEPGPETQRHAIEQLLQEILNVLANLDMETTQLQQKFDEIIEKIVTDPQMVAE